ncbi:TPA: hypothetical protein ACT3KN_003344, partial [Klebsiella quasipneumoniae subsp. similipneumoniae]
KQKAQSKDWAFLRLCHPGRVPACPPGGAALTGATDPEPQNLVRSTVSRQTTMPVRYYQQ